MCVLTERPGGVIAIGPRAVGVFAFGGAALGIFAFGGLACGVISMGGLAVALLFTWAGMGIASFSYAGIAIGLLAVGWLAVGVVTNGAVSLSLWTPAPSSPARLTYYDMETVPEWLRSFDSLMNSGHFHLTLMLTLVPLLLAAVFIPHWLQIRESRRVKTADPRLIEE